MMSDQRSVVVIGGTRGIGREIAQHFADRDCTVVLSGRDARKAAAVAKELGGRARGIGVDLTRPTEVANALSDLGQVDHLILAAIERDENRTRDLDIVRATQLVTLKLVGYIEVVHALVSRLARDSSIVVFGGLAKDRPYQGSTIVSTVNGGVTGMVHTLAVELAPVRVNAIHPGIVGNSPYWSAKPAAVLEGVISRTPTQRLTTMVDVVDAVVFLLSNPSVNGVNLNVDGGWLLL